MKHTEYGVCHTSTVLLEFMKYTLMSVFQSSSDSTQYSDNGTEQSAGIR
jgi:hypothetical protein